MTDETLRKFIECVYLQGRLDEKHENHLIRERDYAELTTANMARMTRGSQCVDYGEEWLNGILRRKQKL